MPNLGAVSDLPFRYLLIPCGIADFLQSRISPVFKFEIGLRDRDCIARFRISNRSPQTTNLSQYDGCVSGQGALLGGRTDECPGGDILIILSLSCNTSWKGKISRQSSESSQPFPYLLALRYVPLNIPRDERLPQAPDAGTGFPE